ncbi:MAG: pilus assembly protein PilM [Clostridia bacterium]|nr:pilus assembly protein PilM [Clostridia bacterium]
MMFPFTFSGLGKVFLKNDILSIDIGFTNIKIVHVRKKSGNTVKVLNFGISSTPSGCIKNGIISDMEQIAENLKKIIEECGISEKNVKIVISAGSNIISKVIFVLKVNGKKAEDCIREQLSKQMPVDIHKQKLFYRITGETLIGGAPYYKVLVTVVPNTTIDNYVGLIKHLKFKPIAIEIPFRSVAKFFSTGVTVAQDDGWRYDMKYLSIDSGATAVVDLGSETTNLSVLNSGALEFNRIILAGGRNLDEIIARKLGVGREVAERYKKMHGIVNKRHMGDEIEEMVDGCVREYLGEILRNVKRSLEFYVNRCGGQPIERLLFIGGGSGLKGLKHFSTEILEIPVYTIDTMNFKNVEFENSLDREKIRFLISALGLAM